MFRQLREWAALKILDLYRYHLRSELVRCERKRARILADLEAVEPRRWG